MKQGGRTHSNASDTYGGEEGPAGAALRVGETDLAVDIETRGGRHKSEVLSDCTINSRG
jgi:hypothetical protein